MPHLPPLDTPLPLHALSATAQKETISSVIKHFKKLLEALFCEEIDKRVAMDTYKTAARPPVKTSKGEIQRVILFLCSYVLMFLCSSSVTVFVHMELCLFLLFLFLFFFLLRHFGWLDLAWLGLLDLRLVYVRYFTNFSSH